jgi:sugar lactone lactonase YvrE
MTTTSRWVSIGLVVLAVAAGGAAAVWWRTSSASRTQKLPPGWPAIAAVLAGDGVPDVRDGSADRARFSDPFGVVSAPDGTVYVADAGDAQRIRRIAPDGAVSTLAGGGLGYADGPADQARFRTPSGLAIDAAGMLYVADTGNNLIRRVAPDGAVSTVAGGLDAGFRDAPGSRARFNGPIGVAVDGTGRIIVADSYNDRIRAIYPDGSVVTIAGTGEPGAVDGPAADAQFDTPSGVAVDAAGNIYVADTGNGAVRMIAPDGFVSTVGPPPPFGLLRPIGIGVSADGLLYITDDRGRVIEITPQSDVRVVVGKEPGFADGPGSAARFRALGGLTVVRPGRLVVVDSRNALIRLVVARSDPQLPLPVSPRVRPQFDVETFESEPLLWPIDPMDGPFEITGTLGEARGGEGSERFHAGIDVHAAEGTSVRAVRTGVVTSPLAASDFATLNESVRIGPITYVHLRVGRQRGGDLVDPSRFVANYDEQGRMVRLRVKRGARFTTGEVVGTANPFNHVHLNVGWPGEEYNPLRFRLVQFEDSVAPTIARSGIRLFREDGTLFSERRKGRLIVDGRVRIVVDAWDQVNGNERRRRLGLYRLGYQVLNADGSPVVGFEEPQETIRFDRLLPDGDAARDVYASGSGIPFFRRGTTRFLYSVTSTLREGIASPGVWDTSALSPGNYTLRILAADIEGNQALSNRDLPVTVLSEVAAQ